MADLASAAEQPNEATGWVVHIPLTVPDRAAAVDLADLIAHLADLQEVVAGGITVSREDEQSARVRVYCDRIIADLPGRQRCVLRGGHSTPHAPANR